MSYITEEQREAFRHHRLELVAGHELVKVFYLKEPGSQHMRTQLVFTDEGITITGDIALGRDGSGIGTPTYKSLDWFLGNLSEKYLCSKFLTRTFQLEVAVEDVLDILGQQEDGGGEWEALLLSLRDCCHDAQALHVVGRAYDATDDPDSFEHLGMDYPRRDAGWLCLIQQTFSRLYGETEKPT